MNGKRAKELRAEAKNSGITDKTSYQHVDGTYREKPILDHKVLDTDGKPSLVGKYSTVTFEMESCLRKTYKLLKKKVKSTNNSSLNLG